MIPEKHLRHALNKSPQGVIVFRIVSGPLFPGDKINSLLGSVIALTGEGGDIKTRYGYSAFGESESSGEESDNPLGYTGREEDGTGLYYYRARYYDPGLKRFIARDPIGLQGGLNVYGYVFGDPVSLVDPYGLYSGWTGPTGAVFGAIGGSLVASGAIAAASGAPSVGVPVAMVGVGFTLVGGALTAYDIYATAKDAFGKVDGVRKEVDDVIKELEEAMEFLYPDKPAKDCK